MSETYGFDARALVLVDEGGPVAGFAYTVVDDARGPRVVGFPFSDFCEPVVPDLESWRRLVRPVIGLGPLSLRCRQGLPPADDADFRRRTDHLWHAISVDPDVDADTRFGRLDRQFRQNIRRARRAGVTVEIGTTVPHLRTFYDLHVKTRLSKHRLLPQPYSFFERLHHVFGGDLMVALAYADARPIAGILFLASGGSLYYKFNASDPEADLRVRPNELLLWEGIGLAASHGCDRIDLGVSSVGQSGLVRYKRKLADQEREVVSLHHGRRTPPANERVAELVAAVDSLIHSEGVSRDLADGLSQIVQTGGSSDLTAEEVDRMLGQVAELLVDGPCDPAVAERAGDLLYRYFA